MDPLHISGKFCLNKLLISAMFYVYLAPYEVDFTCELLHNVTKRWKFVAKKEKKAERKR